MVVAHRYCENDDKSDNGTEANRCHSFREANRLADTNKTPDTEGRIRTIVARQTAVDLDFDWFKIAVATFFVAVYCEFGRFAPIQIQVISAIAPNRKQLFIGRLNQSTRETSTRTHNSFARTMRGPTAVRYELWGSRSSPWNGPASYPKHEYSTKRSTAIEGSRPPHTTKKKIKATRWTLWGSDSADPTVSSMSVLLDRLSSEGNYVKWVRGGGYRIPR
jgi:hypothetical protein